jgi:hypothetical protein
VTFPSDRLLQTSARARLSVAAIAVACLWAAVFWANLPAPSPATSASSRLPVASSLHVVVAADQPAPKGGVFDRFDVDAQPIVAPVNAKGQVAFYARLIRAKKAEGIFLATGSRILKIAAIGDPVPGGGKLSEFAKHPIPSLNDAGEVAFGAAVTGGATTEGIFLAANSGLKVIAVAGADAPGVPTGTFVDFDTPTLNNNDEVAFVATIRRGRETMQALYLYRSGSLVKLVASGDLTPRGGTFDKFGVPAMNQKGVIAFPATVEHGTMLGGIFVAGTRDLGLLVAAGEITPNGAMLVRFSERLAIDDDDNVAFGAHLNAGGSEAEAVFVANVSGLTRVATIGEPAPDGGHFSAFGAWPSIGPSAMVVFVAAVDGGPGPAGLYVWRNGDIKRVAMVGERLAEGATLASFAINPTTSAGANGGMTFATMADPDVGKSAIYYFGPPPKLD